MRKKLPLILLLFISFLALGLRLWKLGFIPPSLHWDEPSWGYNAYSILKTGRDEYGNFMPLIFKAFGDFKSALYVYLTVLPVAIFGLNEFSVRFMAALFGAISVFLMFYTVRELFSDFKGKVIVGLFASFALALSPWNFHYSRGAWEVNILLVVVLLALIFFLKTEKRNPWLLFLSAFFFGLSFYVYNSAKLLIPLIILGLIVLFKDKLKDYSLKHYLISAVILIVMALPIVQFTFLGGAGGRLRVMNIFSYQRTNEEIVKLSQEEGVSPYIPYGIFHNDLIYFSRGIVGRYLNHFSPRFLFFEGDWTNQRHGVPFAGQMNFLDILFLSAGFIFLIRQKVKNKAFIFYFLLIAPLPAALSRDTVEATRSYFMVFPLIVISAFGMLAILENLRKITKPLGFGMIAILIGGYLFSFIYYLDQFFVHAPIANSTYWQYGYKQAVQHVKENGKNYEKIIFTQKYGQPYIYYLFYTQYPPSQYQKQAKLIENSDGDVGYVSNIDSIEFRDIYWPTDRALKNTLFVGGPYELPDQDIDPSQARVRKEIQSLDGSPAFKIVETLK
ncbi:MAG: glycosyltransferase family 39 protein [bacterium]|nr:glycosyltransferase family 39 protein [bacterium]